ncbi:aminoacyl-tRNA hydrolase [candidate division WOR-3 bacterium]|nr:aminoacyl-tRNA hydrolase [candidate division WOR-3 bacterium]
MKLFVFGLGNPGKRYQMTRHNAGMMALDRFTESFGGKWLKRPDYHKSIVDLGGVKLELVKPQKFMNTSGEVLGIIGMKEDDLKKSLFVADDFEIELGNLRFRRSGSSGGHKGFLSIQTWAGKTYQRLKIGIGPLPEGEDPADFVLSPFDEAQEIKLRETLCKAAEALEDWALKGIDYAMNKYNRLRCSKEEQKDE